MKILWLIFILCGAVACSSDPKNAIARILTSDEFIIEVHNEGCLSNADLNFKVLKVDGRRIFEYPISLDDPAQVRRVMLTPEKEIILMEFLYEGIKEDTGEACTGISTYKVGTFWTRISFEDDTCKMYDYLTRLMK